MTKDRARIFDRRANIKIPALRIVGGNEIEAARVFVVNTGRVHESARAGRLERCGQLANFKPSQIWRKRDQVILFQVSNHLGFATFISFKKVVLILWDHFRARRIRIGQ